MVPIKVSRGGLEGIGNRYTGIQISSLLAFLLLVTLLFGLTYTHIYTYVSTLTRSLKNEERDGERERRIVMEKGYGRGERERGGGERMKGMGWYGGEVHRISHISDPRDVLRDTESFPPRVDRVFLDGLFFFSLPTPSDYTRNRGERGREREGERSSCSSPRGPRASSMDGL